MGNEEAKELCVIATGVYEHALKDLALAYESRSGRRVGFVITNAGGVASKLEASQAADVVMTSSVGIDSLASKGRVVASSKIDIGGMRLGIAVKAGAALPDLDSSDAVRTALRRATVASIDPHGGGTSGPFIERLFQRLGIAEEVRAKGVLCATGADVVRAVSSSRATLGITQAAELIGIAGVAFAGFLPDELQLVTVYSAAVAVNASLPVAAADFIAFMTGPAGAERLRQSGWSLPA
ncbi:MAG TPA: substrate-binding domain-containing protein [Xanthobacteraceae bacterium]|jgi:molybdate transport system substrate-binding protein|nr:substrate-binding domain-containing protein [Xanthobacteraceae bacterium]